MTKEVVKESIFFANGAFYEGSWKNDMKNGHGSFKWPDRSSFTGNWVNNLKKVKEFIFMQMVMNIMESGRMTYRMVRESINSRMAKAMMVNI